MDIASEGPVEKKTCVVVDEEDMALHIGALAKCHVRPMTLHRAFSLFLFDERGRLLLQQRAKSKYTFPLAWTNTVCSHPRNLDKTLEEWIDLRVQDELGWKIARLRERVKVVGKLTYSAYSDATYGEKEVDTLFLLQVSESEKVGLSINGSEVEAVDWVEPSRLKALLADDTKLVTPWFRAIAEGYGGDSFFEQLQLAARGQWPGGDQPQRQGQQQQPEEAGSCASAPRASAAPVVVSWTEERTGHVLPWFRYGNLSVPRAHGTASDLLLQAPFSYLMSNPGKAIRSELVQLYAEVDRGVSAEDARGLSWVVERIHAASLLHDDIEDRSTSRRGAVCSHLLWGTAQTINTGTFNFLRAAQGVDEQLTHRAEPVRSALMREVLATMLDLHRGQNADICWGENSMVPSVRDYMDMVDNKTGRLFAAAARMGSICSGHAALGQAAAQALLDLGRFFQIRDDLCNACDPAYWRSKGFFEDCNEGKISYIVLLFLERTNSTPDSALEADQHWLRERLCDDAPVALEERLRAYDILHAASTLEAVRETCLALLAQLNTQQLFASPRGQKMLAQLYIPHVLDPHKVRAVLESTSHVPAA